MQIHSSFSTSICGRKATSTLQSCISLDQEIHRGAEPSSNKAKVILCREATPHPGSFIVGCMGLAASSPVGVDGCKRCCGIWAITVNSA